MEMTEDAKAQRLDRFSMLVRQAKLRVMLHTEGADDLEEIEKIREAELRVLAYATECLADEVHLDEGGPTDIFEEEIQDRFESVSAVLAAGQSGADADEVDERETVQPGAPLRPGAANRQIRADLLKNAARFAAYSHSRQMPNDFERNEEIARALNRTDEMRSLPKFLLDREVFGSKEAPPDLRGRPDNDFTPETARKLTWELGYLHYVLLDHVWENRAVFADGREAFPAADDQARAELDDLDREIASWEDPALLRLAAQDQEESRRTSRSPSARPVEDFLLREDSPTSQSERSSPFLLEHQPINPATDSAPLHRPSHSSRSQEKGQRTSRAASMDAPSLHEEMSALPSEASSIPSGQGQHQADIDNTQTDPLLPPSPHASQEEDRQPAASTGSALNPSRDQSPVPNRPLKRQREDSSSDDSQAKEHTAKRQQLDRPYDRDRSASRGI